MRKLTLILLLASTACLSRKNLGSSENPIKFALTPGKDSASLMASGNKVKDHLQKDLQVSFEVTVPANYVAVVEAFGTKRADFAILNTMGYLLAHQRYGAEAVFTLTDQGHDTYKGQIIAREDGPKNLQEINGKKFAFADPISTSGHFLPALLFKNLKIVPKETVFAGRHDSVVTMVYQKQVDAGATFWLPDEKGEPWDARRLLLTQFPDIFSKVKVLGYTQELPNEAVVIRKDFPLELRNKIIASLSDWMKTEEGRQTLKELYNCDGLKPATDSTYDPARKMMLELGKKIDDLSL